MIPPHGSFKRYLNPHRCRCEQCRAANAAYRREYNRGERPTRGEMAEARQQHGTPSRRRKGCRCDECVTAWRKWERERRARLRAKVREAA